MPSACQHASELKAMIPGRYAASPLPSAAFFGLHCTPTPEYSCSIFSFINFHKIQFIGPGWIFGDAVNWKLSSPTIVVIFLTLIIIAATPIDHSALIYQLGLFTPLSHL